MSWIRTAVSHWAWTVDGKLSQIAQDIRFHCAHDQYFMISNSPLYIKQYNSCIRCFYTLLFIAQERLVERAGVWLLYSESAHPPRCNQSLMFHPLRALPTVSCSRPCLGLTSAFDHNIRLLLYCAGWKELVRNKLIIISLFCPIIWGQTETELKHWAAPQI